MDKSPGAYNPFINRIVHLPTNNFESLVHLVKGSVGSGVLSMPFAFMHSGLWVGLAGVGVSGFIIYHCITILIRCSHILSQQNKVPSLTYARTAEASFANSHVRCFRPYANCFRLFVDIFICADLFGTCVVYATMMGSTAKSVLEYYQDINLNVRLYILMLTIPLLLLNCIRSLKYLAPLSTVAMILILTGLLMVMYYVFIDLPDITDRPGYVSIMKFPSFFGTTIFALECVAVVMSLENNAKYPENFILFPGVVCAAMLFVTSLYAFVGFMGYWQYGEDTNGLITLNLPNGPMAQCVKVIVAIAVFFTYALQFYAPFEVVWLRTKDNFKEKHQNLANYSLRAFVVVSVVENIYCMIVLILVFFRFHKVCTVLLGVAVPNIGPVISLIGSVCISNLGMVFPAFIEIGTLYDGTNKWLLVKNILCIIFGIIACITGSVLNVIEIIDTY